MAPRALRVVCCYAHADVHITSDDVIVMFHDTTLDRTTDSKGPINQRPYYGENGIEHVRTLKQPAQQIPTFEQLCELLMQPENRHIVLNIDIKPNNDPERLFRIMHTVVSKFPEYETQLAPRLILGLWHPKFIQPAKEHVPTLTRAHIGASPADAIKYFWQDCSAFSLRFTSLINFEGQAFLKKAREDKKDVMVWTVNRKDEMIEAAKWGVKAILTDHTDVLHQLRADLQGTCVTSHAADFDGVCAKNMVPLFSWTNIRYYTPSVWVYSHYSRSEVEQHAGVRTPGLTAVHLCRPAQGHCHVIALEPGPQSLDSHHAVDLGVPDLSRRIIHLCGAGVGAARAFFVGAGA